MSCFVLPVLRARTSPVFSPGAVLGAMLRLSYGPVVLTIAALRCEDKNTSKTDAPNPSWTFVHKSRQSRSLSPGEQDHSRPWNKGLLVGQKKPLQPKHVGPFAFG